MINKIWHTLARMGGIGMIYMYTYRGDSVICKSIYIGYWDTMLIYDSSVLWCPISH
jgi:hypothetical protein